MTATYFNSLGGFSTGLIEVPVVDASGNIVTNLNNLNANVSANAVYAKAYYYANGTAVPKISGSNSVIQFNYGGNFGSDPSFTFDVPNTKVNVDNIQLGNTIYISDASKLKISGGTNGYFLQTDGQGNVTWAQAGTGSNGIPGGSNSQVQFNVNGAFAGDTSLQFNLVSKTLSVTNISASLANLVNVTSNVVSANTTISTNGAIFSGSYTGSDSPNLLIDYSNQTARISANANSSISFYNSGVGNIQLLNIGSTGTLTTKSDIISGGNINLSNNRIINSALPANPTDVTNKSYVDGLVLQLTTTINDLTTQLQQLQQMTGAVSFTNTNFINPQNSGYVAAII